MRTFSIVIIRINNSRLIKVLGGYFGYHSHDDVIKWKHFPRYWPFVWGIHRSPVNSPHKGQWRGALMFALICAWINGWVNNGEAGDLRHRCAHYDVIVMLPQLSSFFVRFEGVHTLHILWSIPIPLCKKYMNHICVYPCIVSACIYMYTYQKKFSYTWWWNCGSRNFSETWNVGCT